MPYINFESGFAASLNSSKVNEYPSFGALNFKKIQKNNASILNKEKRKSVQELKVS